MRFLWPSARLVRLAAICTVGAIAAIAIPVLTTLVIGGGAVVAALVIVDLVACVGETGPRLDRTMPSRFVKGRAAAIGYRIERSTGGDTNIEILDELPQALGGDLEVVSGPIGRGQRLEVSREVVPLRRGTFPLGPTFMLWLSPLGLLRMRTRIPAGEAAVVLPAASMPERRGVLDHRSLQDELGVKPRPRRGEGREFESLREYVSGDDPRYIDWRASARNQHLQVRQYQTERRHTVIVAIDTSRLMGARVGGVTKLDHAINCAAALARASLALGDRVGLVAFDRQLRLLVRPLAGRAGAGALVEATSPLMPSPFEADYRVLVETLARNQSKRSLVVILTDFVEGAASGELENYLAVLARRHLVLLVAMRDPILGEADQHGGAITDEGIYRRLVLQDLITEREAVLARVRRFGAQVLDLDPAQVTAPVLNRYLAVREAALI